MRWLEHSFGFPFFVGSGMNTVLRQYFSKFPLGLISSIVFFQKASHGCLHITHTISTTSSPAAFYSSMGIPDSNL